MLFTLIVLSLIFVHGCIVAMLNSTRKLMYEIHLAPEPQQTYPYLEVVRTLKVSMMHYGLIWFTTLINLTGESIDLTEYRNVGIIYIAIISVLTTTAALAYFISSRKTVYSRVVSFFIYLLMLINIATILYLAFVGFIIY